MESIWDNEKIRQARKDAELKADEVAENLAITTVYLYFLENGQRQPSQKLINGLAELYKKPVSYFLKYEKNFVQA